MGSTRHSRLLDADCSSVSLLFCQLGCCSQSARWCIPVAPACNIKFPMISLQSVTVCGHVVPPGQALWRMEVCHFADCFPEIVFLYKSAVLVEHYKSIRRSFLRFSFQPPSSPARCISLMGSTSPQCKKKIQTTVSLSLSVSG